MVSFANSAVRAANHFSESGVPSGKRTILLRTGGFLNQLVEKLGFLNETGDFGHFLPASLRIFSVYCPSQVSQPRPIPWYLRTPS